VVEQTASVPAGFVSFTVRVVDVNGNPFPESTTAAQVCPSGLQDNSGLCPEGQNVFGTALGGGYFSFVVPDGMYNLDVSARDTGYPNPYILPDGTRLSLTNVFNRTPSALDGQSITIDDQSGPSFFVHDPNGNPFPIRAVRVTACDIAFKPCPFFGEHMVIYAFDDVGNGAITLPLEAGKKYEISATCSDPSNPNVPAHAAVPITGTGAELAGRTLVIDSCTS
jgi:hypothetical protein